MTKADIAIGTRFGHLVVIGEGVPLLNNRNGRNDYFESTVVVKCDCGNERTIAIHRLKCRLSCGRKCPYCFESITRHGESSTRLYKILINMRQRCGNPKNPHYAEYGGRGITICDEWISDFAAFREWALSNGYNDALTIDRIDPNGNYEPSNCRWLSLSKQQSNRRSCIMLSMNGKTQTLAAWARELGMDPMGLKNRIRRGWSVEKALTTPKRG